MMRKIWKTIKTPQSLTELDVLNVICRAYLRAVVTVHLDGCFSVLGSLHVEL